MFAQGTTGCDVRASFGHPRIRTVLAQLLLTMACLLPIGCRKDASIRMQISDADILRANAISQEAEIAFTRKDYYRTAIKCLESLRINPNNEYVHNRLGMAYSHLQLFDQAMAAYNQSIRLNKSYPYPYNNLGAVYFARGDMKKAEKYFKKAIRLKAGESSFHSNLGSVYLERNKPEKAMAEWRKAVALDHKALTASGAVTLMGGGRLLMKRRYMIARLYASHGDAHSAIDNLKEAVANGFTDIEDLRKNSDFDPIRKDKLFSEFLQELPLLIKLRSQAQP